MSDTVIQVEDLSKRYRLGVVGTGTLSHDLNRWWARVRRRPDPTLKVDQVAVSSRRLPAGGDEAQSAGAAASGLQPPPSDYVWALKDLSLEVCHGEILGIIGANGAGKSTLLKILSRVTAPTSGEVRVRGRIASLLEVGTGFHPELTGRENILLNGAILGMKKAETMRKLDAIADFSGVQQYIDTPVKRYSSGMYVRLAFAVAAHLDPEILVVDEVLAVGDFAFQKKCLARMEDVAGGGRTVLFVSHNMASVASLCSRSVLLSHGAVRADGPTAEIVAQYVEGVESVPAERVWPQVADAPGGRSARLLAIRVRDCAGRVASQVEFSGECSIEIDYVNLSEGARLNCTIQVVDSMGSMVLSSFNADSACIVPDPWFDRPMPQGRYRSTVTIPGALLNAGSYNVNVFVQKDLDLNYYLAHAMDAVSFTVVEDGAMRAEYQGGWGGVIRPRLAWRTAKLHS